MWPWEHAAVGYIVYSLLSRSTTRTPPGDATALAVVFGTQFPDLVDKPLAWWLAVLPAGRSLAHSALVAFPLVTAALLFAAVLGRTELGVAFGIGYLTHLPADVLYPALVGEGPDFAFLLYPLVEREPYDGPPLVERVTELVGEFGAFLGTPRGAVYLLCELLLVGVAVALGTLDGMPVLGAFRRRVRRVIPV